jgi:nitrogen fixation/metabolism regulation signal transduction histidine kinase
MAKTSLQGRFIFLLSGILIACVGLTVFLTLKVPYWPLVLPLAVLTAFLAILIAVKRFFAPVTTTLQALRSGVASFKDRDYSVTIATSRDDELGELVGVYNELAGALRKERFGLFQRELLLDTVIQSSAVAVLIVNPGGAIVYSNQEAVKLFREAGENVAVLEGESLEKICSRQSRLLADALAAGKDGLFTLGTEAEPEVFHLTCRRFTLNGSTHQLYLLKKLTREIARKEVETWKKLIRVITHEMNNSLAPITSLMVSAQKLTDMGADKEKLKEIYTSVGNRAGHLQSFIAEYARFARLPKPRVQTVQWQLLVEQIRRLVDFQLAEPLPEQTAEFDPVQIEQVLINLIKNAAESGSTASDIQLRVLQNSREILMAVEDRGSGMAPEQMELALLPFYSTKRSGTGLGLPLCREIVEAHGGSFNLFSRQGGGVAAVCKLPVAGA